MQMNYNVSYYFRHPITFIEDIGREIKWAWQRVFRGWDDRAAWSVDTWMFEILPQILRQLKENKHGIPMFCFDAVNAKTNEKYEYSDSEYERAGTYFNNILDKMISGFDAGYKLTEQDLNAYKKFDEYIADKKLDFSFESNSPYQKARKEFNIMEKIKAEEKELSAKLDTALELFAKYHSCLWD